MPVQVEVMVDHGQHVFVVNAESVVELPNTGDSITCKVCDKKNSIIVRVGVPHRTGVRHIPDVSDNQRSLLEE